MLEIVTSIRGEMRAIIEDYGLVYVERNPE